MTVPSSVCPGVKVLFRVDESTYTPVRDYFKVRGKAMGKDHPAAWLREFGGGRFSIPNSATICVLYTSRSAKSMWLKACAGRCGGEVASEMSVPWRAVPASFLSNKKGMTVHPARR